MAGMRLHLPQRLVACDRFLFCCSRLLVQVALSPKALYEAGTVAAIAAFTRSAMYLLGKGMRSGRAAPFANCLHVRGRDMDASRVCHVVVLIWPMFVLSASGNTMTPCSCEGMRWPSCATSAPALQLFLLLSTTGGERSRGSSSLRSRKWAGTVAMAVCVAVVLVPKGAQLRAATSYGVTRGARTLEVQLLRVALSFRLGLLPMIVDVTRIL